MKLLIGAPLHQDLDDGVDRWLKNVSGFHYPADLLLVDSSPDTNYVKRLKSYCEKHGLKNYKVEHIRHHQPNGLDEAIGRSREAIRQAVLKDNYDAWLSWEPGQSLSAVNMAKLAELVDTMTGESLAMLEFRPTAREIPVEPDDSLKCFLASRAYLKTHGFLLTHPGMPNVWFGSAKWFKKDTGEGYMGVFGQPAV